MKLCNALVHNIFSWSQQNFAHVTTLTLELHVRNFAVIGWAYFKAEPCKFSSNFEFDWNTVSGTGASSITGMVYSEKTVVITLSETWIKCPTLYRQHFEMHFTKYRTLQFDSNITKIYYWGPIDYKSSLEQAKSHCQNHQYHMASHGHNDLIQQW